MEYNSTHTGAQIDNAVDDVINNKERWNKPAASNVYFTDGETFQQKYDSGQLKGENGAKGDKGDKGDKGADGASVTVSSVSESSADGGSNVVTFSDGKKLTVKNGKTGAKGDKGDPGSDATVTVDSALSATSTNPIQNKAVTAAVNANKDAIETAERVIAAVSEAAEETADSLYQHVHDKANPHNVTASQVGAPTVAQMNDAIAAASLGGGGGTGGGGGAGSWDDLGNGIGMGTILEETTLASVTTNLSEELGLIVGNTYTVKWNGVDYTPTATDASALTGVDGAILLGMSGGYPFSILVKPQNGTLITVDSGGTPVTVSVMGVGHITIPIPGKYLPKGTPWFEENGTIELLPQTTADSFTHPEFGQMWMIEAAVDLKVGKTYTIVYNGSSYECVCQTAPAGLIDDPDAVAMGNFSVVGGANTGEPFAMLVSLAFEEVDIIDLVGSSSVALSIIVEGEIAHKLDNRCLDLAWLPTIESNAEVLSPRTTNHGVPTFADFNTVENPVGLPFVVHFNDERYECVMQSMTEDGMSAYFLGNTMVVSGDFDGTGEPFLFFKTPDENFWRCFLATSKFVDGKVSIAVYGPAYNKMPDNFLPKNLFKNEDESFVLTSTENADGYRRKFRITIDYNGAFSITPI